MARDYRHRAQPKQRPRNTPGWVWLLVGIVVGVFTSALLWLKFGPSADENAWIGVAPKCPDPVQSAERTAQAKPHVAHPSLRFDFPEILRERETFIPDQELEAPEKPAPVISRTEPEPVQRYLLQVASFRKAADAERLKAQLAFLGYQTSLQKADATDGGVLHRVRLGPYPTLEDAKTQKRKLSTKGHDDSIVIRVSQ